MLAGVGFWNQYTYRARTRKYDNSSLVHLGSVTHIIRPNDPLPESCQQLGLGLEHTGNLEFVRLHLGERGRLALGYKVERFSATGGATSGYRHEIYLLSWLYIFYMLKKEGASLQALGSKRKVTMMCGGTISLFKRGIMPK